MAIRGNRGGGGDRVLESRHVIGLFMLMLVFSGVFFALGYVMGRNQYDGQVRAESTPRATPDPVFQSKNDLAATRKKNSQSSATSTSQCSELLEFFRLDGFRLGLAFFHSFARVRAIPFPHRTLPRTTAPRRVPIGTSTTRQRTRRMIG